MKKSSNGRKGEPPTAARVCSASIPLGRLLSLLKMFLANRLILGILLLHSLCLFLGTQLWEIIMGRSGLWALVKRKCKPFSQSMIRSCDSGRSKKIANMCLQILPHLLPNFPLTTWWVSSNRRFSRARTLRKYCCEMCTIVMIFPNDTVRWWQDLCLPESLPCCQ